MPIKLDLWKIYPIKVTRFLIKMKLQVGLKDNNLNIKKKSRLYMVCDFDNTKFLIKKLQQNNFYTAH